MKIIFTSDIHASNRHLFSLLSIAREEKTDAMLIGGDIIPHYLPYNASDILQAQAIYLREVFIPAMKDFRKKRQIPVYLDFGNDDFISNRNILEEYDGELFYLLHEQKYALTDTVDIIAYMNVPITPFGRKDFEKTDTPEQLFAPMNDVSWEGYISRRGRLERTILQPDTDHTIAHDLEKLSRFIDKPFIFVSHAPPYDTPLDVLYDGLHVGSLGIRNFIEYWSSKKKLIASFHGHIHESPGRSGSIQTKIGNSLCINPGQSSGPAAILRHVIFELIVNQSGRPDIRIISCP